MLLLLLGSAVIAAVPSPKPIKIMPQFSWDTLPVAWHSGNSTGRYTAAQIQELSRYAMVTLEKFQNVRAVVPAKTLGPPYEAPEGLYACQENRSMSRCGCCEEDEIVAVARAIKASHKAIVRRFPR